MAPERIAFVTTAGGYWGAEEAGLAMITIEDPAQLVETLRSLAAGGKYAVIAVSEEAAAGREADLEAIMEQAPGQVSIVTVPAPGARSVAELALLRERFAAALGVDVWKMAVEKAGVDV